MKYILIPLPLSLVRIMIPLCQVDNIDDNNNADAAAYDDDDYHDVLSRIVISGLVIVIDVVINIINLEILTNHFSSFRSHVHV